MTPKAKAMLTGVLLVSYRVGRSQVGGFFVCTVVIYTVYEFVFFLFPVWDYSCSILLIRIIMFEQLLCLYVCDSVCVRVMLT